MQIESRSLPAYESQSSAAKGGPQPRVSPPPAQNVNDMGDDMIQVKPPGAARESAISLAVNRNKRSMTLNQAARRCNQRHRIDPGLFPNISHRAGLEILV